MKARRLALFAAGAGALAGLLVWRRRSARAPEPVVQLGLADGSVHSFHLTDPATARLQALAVGVRDPFTGGA
ncbi:MAG TPA: hypothetical protein VMH50_03275 [Thermoleophilia bacterium]|nr:hypothetical protein [Thermoleophilia bacterium]